MNLLHHEAVYPFFPDLVLLYEEIYAQVDLIMQEAESLQKLQPGEIATSPAYNMTCMVLLYWQTQKDHYNKLYYNVRQRIVL